MVETRIEYRIAELSPAQIDCLRLVASGVSKSKAIARELNLQPGTVDTYLSRACKLLDADTRQIAAERYLDALNGPAQNSGSLSRSRSNRLGNPTTAGSFRPTTGVRWLFDVPPIGGIEQDLNWIEKTLAILRIAIVSLCLLAIIIVAGAGLLWLAG